jgi:hypothetical protein
MLMHLFHLYLKFEIQSSEKKQKNGYPLLTQAEHWCSSDGCPLTWMLSCANTSCRIFLEEVASVSKSQKRAGA